MPKDMDFNFYNQIFLDFSCKKNRDAIRIESLSPHAMHKY